VALRVRWRTWKRTCAAWYVDLGEAGRTKFCTNLIGLVGLVLFGVGVFLWLGFSALCICVGALFLVGSVSKAKS